tara:strand:+ start:210 stop:440 length:231 start_codon:yes stop_codon:yes gene_type:complete
MKFILKSISQLKNIVIFVTGGIGSFGKSFTNFLIKTIPIKKLIVFSIDKQKHFKMMSKYKNEKIRFVVVDVRDYQI